LTNSTAIKNLIEELEKIPHAIGLAILRERLLTYCERDLKAIEENPEQWNNAFIHSGMYKDFMNRVINNLKFE
jgi:hypothetical protein